MQRDLDTCEKWAGESFSSDLYLIEGTWVVPPFSDYLIFKLIEKPTKEEFLVKIHVKEMLSVGPDNMNVDIVLERHVRDIKNYRRFKERVAVNE